MKITRNEVFVSYSHADAEYLARLKVHIRPFERLGVVNLWADTKIKTGAMWKREIEDALNRAAVAIFLVSADFLASDFVVENELPPLLKAAENGGVRIIPLILKPCAFTSIPELSQFQAINDPATPLISTEESNQELLWCSVAREVKTVLENNIAMPVALDKTPTNETNLSIKESLKKQISPPEYYWGLCSEELRDPDIVSEFFAYSYHFLDDLSFMSKPDLHFDVFSTFETLIKAIKNRFRQEGWEGDGNIQIFWLPPFVGAGVDDTHGVCVWHVKQNNNGTSWLLSPVPLPFGRLLEQQS